MKNRSYKLADGIVFRDYKDFGLVINVPLRKNIILNSAASKILSLMKKKVSIPALMSKARSNEMVELTKKDLLQILSRFEKQKIISAS